MRRRGEAAEDRAGLPLRARAPTRPQIVVPPLSPPLDGKHRPCWCSSGKKLKICHNALAQPPAGG